MHQQDVIHSLIVFALSATTCTNVNCVWSAIAVVTPHDTLCVRCHNEVCSSFSLVRALTDTHMPTVHRTANITTTPQTTPTLVRSRQNSTTSSTASLRWWRFSAVTSPCFVMQVSKSGKCFHIPYHGLDALTHVDNTDPGSNEHFFPAPSFQTTKTSRHSGKRAARIEVW